MTNRLLDYRPLRVPPPPQAKEDEQGGWLTQRFNQARTFVEQTMGKYPAATLLVGVSMGVALGWFIKRRATDRRRPSDR
jgi:hypothetical protein